jgi:hypothetical protein
MPRNPTHSIPRQLQRPLGCAVAIIAVRRRPNADKWGTTILSHDRVRYAADDRHMHLVCDRVNDSAYDQTGDGYAPTVPFEAGLKPEAKDTAQHARDAKIHNAPQPTDLRWPIF